MERLGKYEIVAQIGVGGFGVVYKGIDPFIKRPVAIKTCSARDDETRERFLREAEIAGNLQHRNIVTIFEFGFHEETPYLVQEFLSGEDLDHKIRRNDEVPTAIKTAWLVEIARGLAYAHARGVVHRDVKPANIRVLDDGHVKILDFGIAKLARQQSHLTEAGVTLGTASYLAPEQIRNEPADPRTDVFSFGILAYELLSYDKPFRAQEISALFYKLLNEAAPPLSGKVRGLPMELIRVVDRCLAKDPARRFAPTTELLHALEKLQPRPISTGIVPRPPAAEPTRPVERVAKTSVLPPRASDLAAGDTVALAQLELRTAPDGARPESRGMAPAGGAMARHWILVTGGAAVVAAALVAGWLGGEGTVADEIEPATALSSKSAASAAQEPTAAVEPPARTEVPAPPAHKSPEGPTVTPPTEETPPTGIAPEPTPPPPPPPRPARLIVGPAWDPAMQVRVGGRRLRLDRERSLEVPAGVLVLQFSLVRPEYSAEEPLRLELAPGARERVAIPIEPPGRLSVQPHLGARPGQLRLDGLALGSSPVRDRWLAPGDHYLEIYSAADSAEPALTQSLSIRSGVESIVTFDLDGELETLVRERPVERP